MTGTVKSLSPSRELGDFCDFLYGKEQGYAYLPTKNEEGSPQPWTPYFFVWPEQKAQLVKHALKMSEVRDVYIAPSLFSKPEAKIDLALGANVLWADFDGDVPSNSQLAEHNVPKPTLRIQSSPGRQHLYWKLDQFNTDIKMIQDLNRAVAYETGADPSGWDMNQVLRPVGTLNHKRGGTPVVITGGDMSARYVPIDFAEVPVPESLIEKIPTLNGNLPRAQRVIAKYPFNQKEADLLFKPEMQEGMRSTSLAALGHILCEKGMDNAEIYSLIVWVDSRWGKFAGRDDAEKRYLGLLNYLRHKHPYKSALEEKLEEKILHLQFMGYRDLLEHTDVQKYFIEPKILPDRGFLYIAGRAGVGKSNMSTELAFRLIFNQDYLDWKIPEQETRHVVMHIQLEMGTTEQKEVALKMDCQFTEEQRDILQEHYKIICIQDAFKLYNQVHVAMLREAIEHIKPTVLLLDSASVSFAPSLKDDEEKIRESAMNLFKLRQEFNFSSVVVGHAKKNTSKADGMDAYFGMSVLEQYLSTGILLTPDTNSTEELRNTGDEDTQVIDLTYTKHRFGTDVGKTYQLHIKSNPLRFERPVIAILPPVPVPKQTKKTVKTDEDELAEAWEKFGI